MDVSDRDSRRDPRRSMELLWGEREAGRRGPKPSMTLEQIVDVAIEIADAEGLSAVSMRRVADGLGVSAMSLYTYVPGKAELLDLMVDAAFGHADRPDHEGAGWRERLRTAARTNHRLYLRHPWLLQLGALRPAIGPNLLAKYDYELRAVAACGISAVEMDLIVNVVGNYVHGAARSTVEAAEAEGATGISDAQWWGMSAPLLAEVVDPDRHPAAADVLGALAESDEDGGLDRTFEFGLELLIDGISLYVDR